jgi:RNA polymerase sigma-70 factor, ECF subfamily
VPKLIYMCDSAHTIILLFLRLTASKKVLAIRRLRRTPVQLSRKPALSLVRTQPSTAGPVGTLLPWIAKGDEAAFRLFFEATNGLLFGLLLRILGHTETAEEVLSELYEEVRRRAAQFGKQNERPLTWLILMAHRRAIERLCNHLNTNREKLRTSGGKTKSTSSINITAQRRLVHEVLEAIPPLHHQMIELAFFSGMTNLEIAKEVGQPPAVVEAGLRYAMLQLFGLFKSMGFSGDPGTQT